MENSKLHFLPEEHLTWLHVGRPVTHFRRKLINPIPFMPSLGVRHLSIRLKLFIQSSCPLKPLCQFQPNLAGMVLGWSSFRSMSLVLIRFSTWLPGPIMCSDWMKFQKSSCQKLYSWWNYCSVNDPWVVLYQNCVFGADSKSKMAPTAIKSLNFNIGPYGNFIQSSTYLKPLSQFQPDLSWMVIWWNTFKFVFGFPRSNPIWSPLPNLV